MKLLRKIYYGLTPNLRFCVRRIFYLPYDAFVFLFKKRDPLIPPRGMIFIGSGDFVKQGNHLAELVKTYTRLRPDDRILDIGCGIGRLAVPLTKYLSKDGIYEGFDIVQFGIDWCIKNITSRYPNFHFKCVSLKNDLYNLNTRDEAKSFVFPYPKDYFDCVVLTSVFTHMMPDDVENYLRQIALTLKEGGRCLATFFIINQEVKNAMDKNEIGFKFNYSYGNYHLMHSSVKEANVAFDENFLYAMVANCGLSVESMHRGSWSNGANALDFQDVVILKKQEIPGADGNLR